MVIQRINQNPRMSAALVHNGFAFLSGQVADDTDLDPAGQAKQILDKIDALLAQVGVDKRNILSATIWLANHKDFADFNKVWDAWVPEGHPPARACVESPLAFPQYTVEISVIAAV